MIENGFYSLSVTMPCDAIPKTHPFAVAEFVTLREKLLKIGARIVETASRIKLALATACPQGGYSDTSPAPCSLRDRERRGRDSVRSPQITHPSNSNAFEKCGSTQRQRRNSELRPQSCRKENR